MIINEKNNLFQALQNAVQGLNVPALVQTVLENTKAAQDALRLVDSVQMSGVISTAAAPPRTISPPADAPPVYAPDAERGSPHLKMIGEAINSAFLFVYPDLKMDGKMEVYDAGGKSNDPKAKTNTYVVNGVHQNEASRAKQAEDAAETLGKPVNLIHNSSAVPLDAFEYLMEAFLGYPSPASQKLSDEVYQKLTKKPPENVEIVSYSQGSAQTAIALSLTIKRMQEDGMSDEQIRDIMREHVDVTCVGTPLDPKNPSQAVWNIPPGPIPSEKRLDWYFQEQDVVLHGDFPATSHSVTDEPGGEPNFKMIRHEKDPVASWVRSLGDFPDLAALGFSVATMGPFFLFNPALSIYVGVRVADIGFRMGQNLVEQQDAFGYHDYKVYDHYMRYEFSNPEKETDHTPVSDHVY